MNRVQQHLGTQYPIVQSPMSWIARSPLASAVSEAGGMGIIESGSGESEQIAAEIVKMRELTDKPFGVNLALLFMRDESMLDNVIEAEVKFVTTSAGSPRKYIDRLKEHDIIVYHAVPTAEFALKAADAGVDGLIVEGAEGGGFKNPEEVALPVLLQMIRDVCDLPMIAAGGIVDGRGMAAAFAAGAEGIQMGTRFVSSVESPVHDNFKNAIINSSETGTIYLNRKGSPGLRALKTEHSLAMAESEESDRAVLFGGGAKDLYFGGDMESSIALSGQGAGMITSIKTVKDIIDDTVSEYFEICADLGARAQARRF
ncbi:MAG: nitronate monooxygenase [Alphaproteobacteria bacterium]|nr:MAG: nitronate monooxygenase [Alphaproteobacteria bacterium]